MSKQRVKDLSMSTITMPISREEWATAIEDEERAFRGQLDSLMERYEGEYVAMYRGEVVAHGMDDSPLFGQAHKKLGYVPFLIELVSYEPEIIIIEAIGAVV
jgi:hypothetical protein